MLQLKYLKLFAPVIFFCAISVLFPHLSQAAQSYSEAILAAQANIDSNTNFIPLDSSIITIKGSTSLDNPSYGLTYNSTFGDGKSYLVVRTLTNVAYYENGSGALKYGVGDYTTFNDSVNHQASWVTTGNDATKFIDNHVSSPGTLVSSMEQGLGMDNSAGGTHTAIVEYGVLPDNDHLNRPTRQSDITAYSTTSSDYAFTNPFTPTQSTGMSDATYSHLQTYLDFWQTDTLSKGGWHGLTVSPSSHWFPWTELGYTYYWGHDTNDLAAIQGSSEFVILGGSTIKIIGVYSPQSYMYTRNKNGAFSTDSDAEFGNGFGSFNVTGNCDTIWAGNAFQANASTDANNPNQIILASGKTISGGQGILVWSPNYTLTNYGTISGATAKKLADAFKGGAGMSGTANVAVLFLGDTTFGDIPGGKNKVVNSGTISSPGTAIESDAGDTEITNTGTISGDSYALRFKGGTNSITNSGSITSADTAIRIEAGTTSINSTGTVSGHVTLVSEPTAALDIGNSTLTISGSGVYTQSSQTTLKMTANSSTDFGKITATGANAVVAADSTLYVTTGGYIPNNTTFSNVISSTGTGVNVPTTITPSSPIFTFAGANGTGDHLNLTATRAHSYNSFTTNANSSATGTVLNTLAMNSSTTGSIINVLGGLDSLSSGADINSALNSLAPNVDNSAPQVGFETQTKFVNTAIDHINTVFGTAGAPPVPSGAFDPAVWAQTFDSYLHQDPRGTSNGYNANVWGIIGGYDMQVRPDLAFGVSAGYAYDNVRGKDFSNRSGINNYQLGIYGSFTRSSYYVDGIFSFAYNRYDASRNVAFVGFNVTPTANYGGEQYSSYFEGGYKFEHKKFALTPLASIQYTRLNINGYTEDNGGGAGLTVKSQGSNFLQSGLGAKAEYRIEKKDYSIIPDFHFKWLYSFINDNQQATSTFGGGGASFLTSGFNLPTSSYDLGTKWTILTKHNTSVSLNYDYELNPDFYSHSAYLNVRHEF